MKLYSKPGSAVPYQPNAGVSLGTILIEILMVAIGGWWFCAFVLIPFFDWTADLLAGIWRLIS